MCGPFTDCSRIRRLLSMSVVLGVCVGGKAGPRLLAKDCNRNQVADANDIAQGMSADCNSNVIPDECELVFPGVTRAAVRDRLTSSPQT
jgi:hypothetical protein